MTIIEQVESIINNILINKGNTPIKICNNTNLRDDLGFTSFDLAELTVCIEDKFDIDIFEDGLVNTVDEILQKLNK